MKLSKKDKDLIAAERLGKAIRGSIPLVDVLLSKVTDDEDVKNVLTGSSALMLLDTLTGKSKGKLK